jgi:dienelactone hydrolase
MISGTASDAVTIPVGTQTIHGDLRVPPRPRGLVIFAHGSGSSRFSSRNRHVATMLDREGFATLLLDLLTAEEESVDLYTAQYRFDVWRLGHRVSAAVDWAALREELCDLRIGCLGASTGAAAALIAAAERPASIAAVVSRGGRPDLAGEALPYVQAPTLLIVGGRDEEVIEMNRDAMRRMRAPMHLEIVPGATHLFEEPGALDQVAQLAGDWFRRYLGGIAKGIVPADQWDTFLARFSRQHRAWLTTVERGVEGGIPKIAAAARPLDAILPVRGADGTRAIEVRFQDSRGPARLMATNVTEVRVDQSPEGAERGLEIDQEGGACTRLRFRATALPETLDHVAMGELYGTRDESSGGC